MMKSKQQGKVSGALITVLVFIAVIVGVVVMAYTSYIGAYKYGNNLENQLVAVKDNNKNIYAQGTQKVLEIAQVPGMFKDDYTAIIKADIEGRYGKDGLKAQMVFMKERNIQMDPTLYHKIQQVIEAFRDKFEVNQTRQIDVLRSYKTVLGNDYFLGQGFWLKIAGYPKINLDDFKPITTDATETVYKNGKESGPLKLR